jgi:GNAT superfamily N-acetyltransferase
MPGPRDLTRYTQAIRRRVWERQTLWIYGAPRHPVADQSQITVIRATLDDLDDVGWFQGPNYQAFLRSLLLAGQDVYLAYLEGRCVHRSVVVRGPTHIAEHWSVRLPLATGEAYLHQSMTAPAARGRGVYPYLLSTLAAEYADTHLIMAILSGNLSSQRAASKAGWRRIAIADYRVTLGIRRSRRTLLASPTPGQPPVTGDGPTGM